MAERQTRYL